MHKNGSEEVKLLNDRTRLVQGVHNSKAVILFGIFVSNSVDGE